MTIKENIPSQLVGVPGFILTLLGRLEFLKFSPEDAFNIRLCLEEALVNAMKHGNKLNPDLPVEVTVEAEKDSVSFSVHDAGAGFDFQNLADPTIGDNLKKMTGRGVFLIKKLMDRVEFSDNGRTIIMVKFLKP